jgi:hypothetical protein
MATPQIIDSYKTVQVLSDTTVQDIQFITCRTVPTGITFSYAMAHSTWKAGPPYVILIDIETLLEDLVTNSHVVGGSAVQDLDSAGLLADYCDVVVQFDQTAAGLPPLEGTVSLPMGVVALFAGDANIANASGLQTPESRVLDEYARLQALAGE